MCRQLELLHIQPEIKNIVSQFYIEFDKLILGDLIGRGRLFLDPVSSHIEESGFP